MCHHGRRTISLKNNIIYVYVYVKGFTCAEKVDYVLVPIKSSNWTYKDFNDQACILLQPTKRRSEFQMDVYDSNDRKVGNVSIAHNDDIYLAGGAALLLLLKPK